MDNGTSKSLFTTIILIPVFVTTHRFLVTDRSPPDETLVGLGRTGFRTRVRDGPVPHVPGGVIKVTWTVVEGRLRTLDGDERTRSVSGPSRTSSGPKTKRTRRASGEKSQTSPRTAEEG